LDDRLPPLPLGVAEFLHSVGKIYSGNYEGAGPVEPALFLHIRLLLFWHHRSAFPFSRTRSCFSSARCVLRCLIFSTTSSRQSSQAP